MANQQVSTVTKTELTFPNRYNVLLLNDDFTPMDFVIQLLVEVFNKNIADATSLTFKVHNEGQAIAGTYTKEMADQKKAEAQIHARTAGYPLKIVTEKMV